jgi:2-polyprenyl-3-methyl-5-hydroxy-6-metoxy-1,4-benzoquinol methylase
MKSGIRRGVQRAKNLWAKTTDPKRRKELAGTRLVFDHLSQRDFMTSLKGKRILEIGPKHGNDSRLLASLEPEELVLIDLPEKRELVERWLPDLPGNVRFIPGNLLYLGSETLAELGQFDLVWCLGVLYHNVEQLRLLKRLFDLTGTNGHAVVESSTTRHRVLRHMNAVEIHWPRTFRDVPTITHMPSKKAIKSWMEMVGFEDVRVENAYSRDTGRQRAVLSAQKSAQSEAYMSYGFTGENPDYVAGGAD